MQTDSAGGARPTPCQCTNPDCRLEYFRPFSCSVFHLCPSCSQKRTLLLGEYMNEQLLLRLPHKQFVFTLPKVLRVFFRYDKRVHGEISRLIYALVRDFTTEAAGKPVHTAAVLVFQSSGSFCRFHPHWHSLFLEGGFDNEGSFVHIPTVDLAKMSACFRQRVVAFFVERKLLNERLGGEVQHRVARATRSAAGTRVNRSRPMTKSTRTSGSMPVAATSEPSSPAAADRASSTRLLPGARERWKSAGAVLRFAPHHRPGA